MAAINLRTYKLVYTSFIIKINSSIEVQIKHEMRKKYCHLLVIYRSPFSAQLRFEFHILAIF